MAARVRHSRASRRLAKEHPGAKRPMAPARFSLCSGTMVPETAITPLHFHIIPAPTLMPIKKLREFAGLLNHAGFPQCRSHSCPFQLVADWTESLADKVSLPEPDRPQEPSRSARPRQTSQGELSGFGAVRDRSVMLKDRFSRIWDQLTKEALAPEEARVTLSNAVAGQKPLGESDPMRRRKKTVWWFVLAVLPSTRRAASRQTGQPIQRTSPSGPTRSSL